MRVESDVIEVETARGLAVVDADRPAGRLRGLVVLGHGAGGAVDAVDLLAVRDAAVKVGFAVARVTQPYRVAGRRAPPAAPVLDEAFLAVVPICRDWASGDWASGDWASGERAVGDRASWAVPLVVGGRSSGARVACRTARALGAVGVLALAFPLHPPGQPGRSRAGELDPTMPTLVVNGDHDPFGVPDPIGLVEVDLRPGDRHDLRKDPPAVAARCVRWLRDLPGVASLNPTNPT